MTQLKKQIEDIFHKNFMVLGDGWFLNEELKTVYRTCKREIKELFESKLESRPQHKEIEWKGDNAYCGDEYVGRIEQVIGDKKTFYGYILESIIEDDEQFYVYFLSEKEAKEGVELALHKFIQSITK